MAKRQKRKVQDTDAGRKQPTLHAFGFLSGVDAHRKTFPLNTGKYMLDTDLHLQEKAADGLRFTVDPLVEIVVKRERNGKKLCFF